MKREKNELHTQCRLTSQLQYSVVNPTRAGSSGTVGYTYKNGYKLASYNSAIQQQQVQLQTRLSAAGGILFRGGRALIQFISTLTNCNTRFNCITLVNPLRYNQTTYMYT